MSQGTMGARNAHVDADVRRLVELMTYLIEHMYVPQFEKGEFDEWIEEVTELVNNYRTTAHVKGGEPCSDGEG